MWIRVGLMQVVFAPPVHDDPVWDVDALYVLVVVLRVGEQVQTVSWPVVFDLQSHCCSEDGSKKVLEPELGRLAGEELM